MRTFTHQGSPELADYAFHARMDKRMGAQAKMIEAMGLNEETSQQIIQ